MAASHSDSFQLAQDSTFQGRVQQALVTAMIAIQNEGNGVAFHRERSRFVFNSLQSPATLTNATTLFTASVATDTNCLSDATQAGTVVLTSANRAAQAALVTDAHIDTAISSQYNTFLLTPAS